MQQPSLPAMEPLKASGGPPPSMSSVPPMAQAGGMARRLRQIVSYVGGASLGFILLVSAGEMVFKPGLRPSDLVATVESNVELGVMNQRLGHAPGEHILNEAQYRETIAQSERQGQAKAELAYQRDLAAVQADKERVVQAYGTLYQRTNIIAQAGVQMESQALQFRQRLIEATNGGRVMVISIYDGLCAMGNEDSCDKARQARQGMIDESSSLTEGQLAKKVNALMAGIDDPATLVAHRDQRRNGPPTIDRR